MTQTTTPQTEPDTTTRLTFTKHHGLGNDFLVTFHPPVSDLAALARQVCDRRRGIGADGLIVGESAEGYAAQMILFNADGGRAEMSGNGIRCFAQALAGRRGDFEPQRILTDAGERLVSLSPTGDPDTIEASVAMGSVEPLDEPVGWGELGCHPDRPVAHLSVGNPHSVVGVDAVDAVDLVHLGSLVPHINLEIVEPGPEPNAITMRVHERGAGVTEACGTGAVASAFAALQWGLVPASLPEIVVHMDGGSAKVAVDRTTGRTELTGPATYVARIEIEIEIDIT
jgi:diaminopimelate epimerase